MQVVGLNLGEFSRDFGEVAVVEATCVGEHVGLVYEGDLLAAGGSQLEGVAHQALHTVCGVEGDFGGDFMGGAAADNAAVADVGAFGTFTHNDEVNVAGVGKRGNCAGVQTGGAQVDVVVEGEAQLQEHFAFDEAGGNLAAARISTNSAEKNRIVLFERLHRTLGQGLAGFKPVLGAKFIVGGIYANRIKLAGALKHTLRLGNNFRSDAVASDHGKVDGTFSSHTSTLLLARTIAQILGHDSQSMGIYIPA